MYEKAMLCGWIGGFLTPCGNMVYSYTYTDVPLAEAPYPPRPLAIARLAFEPGGLAADDQISLCNWQSEEP